MVVVTACSGTAAHTAEPLPGVAGADFVDPQRMLPVRAPEPDHRPRFPGFAQTYEGEVALAAMAKGELEVFEGRGQREPFLVLPYENMLGSTTVVSLIGAPVDGWAEVRLAMRPNGTTGWIRIEDADLFAVSGRIVVDLSERSLTYFENGVEVMSTTVAVGSDRSQTPVGHFYVTDSVTLTRPGTPWGPHALGLSARSDHVTEFNGGDGIIAIHGTSNPSSIGKAASLGCVRLHNDVITRLHALAPMGTPVEIRA